MATINFSDTKGGAAFLSLGPPTYDLTIAGPPNISIRLETVEIPHMAGKLLVGDGLIDEATLTVSGKIFTATRALNAMACHNIWSALYSHGSHWVTMSGTAVNYPVIYKGSSGEFVRDVADMWGNLSIDLLILDPTDIG